MPATSSPLLCLCDRFHHQPQLNVNPRDGGGRCSCNEGRGGGRVVLESWGNLLLRLVVARKAVDAGLDENEAELGVLVLAVDLEVLAHSDGLLHKVPEILRDLRSKT